MSNIEKGVIKCGVMDLGRADRKALAQEDCNRSAFKPVAIVSVRRPRQCGWNVQAARSVRLNRGQQEIFQRSKRRKMCLHAAILPANSKVWACSG